MTELTTVGVDLAKSVFQVHGVDGSGKPATVPAFVIASWNARA